MIRIEFPADRADIARAIGAALTTIGAAEGRTVGMVPELASGYGNAADFPDHDGAPVCPSAEMPAPDDDDDTAPSEVSCSEVDMHGVAKNPAFCANAKDPFYATGKRSGQWKKRQGVDEGAYDAWYANELDALPAAHEQDATPDEPAVDASAAFQPPAAQTPAQDPGVPTTCGDFMGWAAAQQAAGRFTSVEVGAAYATAGIEVSDLFQGEPADIAQRVATLYYILTGAGH